MRDPNASASLEAAAERLWAWLADDALPLWWERGADHAGGGFHEAIGLDGAPVSAVRRCRVQPRQIHSFAVAARAGWPGPGREAAAHGLDYFLERYRRPDGLFRASVGADGAAADESAVLYDQAFALLGLHAAYRLEPRAELKAAAERLLQAIQHTFRHGGGGYREADAHPFQSNCQMHLFEATSAWAPEGGGDFQATADALAHFALDRLIDPGLGVIDEYYDDDWRPAGPAGAAGGERRIEPGHQFEWAWLLAEWRAAGGDRPTASAVERLFDAGEASVADSLAPAAVDVTGRVSDPLCRLWPQTERLRIAARLAVEADGARAAAYRESAIDAARGLERYLETPIAGLWRDKWTADGGFADEPAPASSLYHLAGAIVALKSRVLDASSAAAGKPS